MSAAIIDKDKDYKPINGSEVIDLILTEFHRQLVNSGLFPIHRVWHEFEIAGGVRVKGWSTKTEDVKFRVETLQSLNGDQGNHPAEAESVAASIAVQLGPGPPDLLRERLEKHPCPKCGRMSGSRAGNVAHQRWCKAESPVMKEIDAGGRFKLLANGQAERVTNENSEPDTTAPAAQNSPSD